MNRRPRDVARFMIEAKAYTGGARRPARSITAIRVTAWGARPDRDLPRDGASAPRRFVGSVMRGRARWTGVARRIDELQGPANEPAEHGAEQRVALAARHIAGAQRDDQRERKADAEVEHADDRDADHRRDERVRADAVDADRRDRQGQRAGR